MTSSTTSTLGKKVKRAHTPYKSFNVKPRSRQDPTLLLPEGAIPVHRISQLFEGNKDQNRRRLQTGPRWDPASEHEHRPLISKGRLDHLQRRLRRDRISVRRRDSEGGGGMTNRGILARRAHNAALIGKSEDQRCSRNDSILKYTLITSAGEHTVVATVPYAAVL